MELQGRTALLLPLLYFCSLITGFTEPLSVAVLNKRGTLMRYQKGKCRAKLSLACVPTIRQSLP